MEKRGVVVGHRSSVLASVLARLRFKKIFFFQLSYEVRPARAGVGRARDDTGSYLVRPMMHDQRLGTVGPLLLDLLS
jgi:hypothetical protein